MKLYDYLIVGAGITGITAANILADRYNKKVLLVEKRSHIGGNCYDSCNKEGIFIHRFGPHIFHTQNKAVWEYVSIFTDWINYIHYVKAYVDKKFITFPININTFEELFERPFSAEKVNEYLNKNCSKNKKIRNAEDMILSRMGKTIYEKFFKNYTRKQWGCDASELSPEITKRIPIRLNRDDRFFTDNYQGIPAKGYTQMFENMLSFRNIDVHTDTDYSEIKNRVKYSHTIFTGPIDEFFQYKFGRLPYRGIKFIFKTFDKQSILPAAVVNYPNDFQYTRVTEFKHMTHQKHEKTTLCYEHPADIIRNNHSVFPSYPVLNSNSKKLYEKYRKEAQGCKNTIFLGRLGQFEYFNMDTCIKQVLNLFRK